MSSILHRQLTCVERVTRVSTALVFLFFTCQLTGCKKDELDAQRLTWGDSLIDVMTVMNAYQLSLETMPDAVSDKPESDEICDPAGSAESHADVIKALDKLAADAPAQGFSKEVVAKLEHIKSEWQLLRTRQEQRWSSLADGERLDPWRRCLRPSDVASTRVPIDRDISDILKALLRTGSSHG